MSKPRLLVLIASSLALLACSRAEHPANEATPQASQALAPLETEAAAGAYKLDRGHASLLFRVDHLGFSFYTARFKQFDAALQFDPANPEAAELTATVDANSLETDYPDPQTIDFNGMLRGQEWLNAAEHPQITYRSMAVQRTGSNTFRIDGELTFRGVTRPMQLDATFNGGYAGHPMDPHARIGFSARGVLKRSEYGMTVGIPEPGSKIGVGDEVEVIIETEFSGPPLAQPGESGASAPAAT